jgi:bifunctional non-homologous end joining protein LigD
MITTTRSLDELVSECLRVGIKPPAFASREQLFDLLRDQLGTTDPSLEVDPMKAQDLKSKINWQAKGTARFAGISQFLTPQWVAEPKLDGCRLRMFLGATANSLNTGRRSVKTFAYLNRSDNFPHLRDAAVASLAGTVLDGEILAPSGKIQTHTGMWTDSLLNASVALVNSKPTGSVQTQKRFGKATYWVFDVLAVSGNNVQHCTYDERRRLLEHTVELLNVHYPECQIKIVPQMPATMESIQASLGAGFEGVMLKLRNGSYLPGKRSNLWQKVKVMSTADAFVVGYSPGENSNDGLVGSLELAVICPDGTVRAFAQVGNLTDDMRQAISAPDGSLKRDFYGTVIEVMAQGLGKNGRTRHAHMVRIRPDKLAAECTEDQLDLFMDV